MTILKNKFYVGQLPYDPIFGDVVKIRKIEENDQGKLEYFCIATVSPKEGDYVYFNCGEDKLYESKEAYEKEKNEIRVGDEFYFICSPSDIIKRKCDKVYSTSLYTSDSGPYSKEWSFKTKDLLLETVKQALEECE